MAKVRVLVLRAAGINCDEEVMHCWRIAGALPTLVHINALAERPAPVPHFGKRAGGDRWLKLRTA